MTMCMLDACPLTGCPQARVGEVLSLLGHHDLSLTYTSQWPPSPGATHVPRAHHDAQVHGGFPSRLSGLPTHARWTVVIRLALLTTERRFWHCGDHTAKPESAV